MKTIAQNKRALHEYEVLEKYEAGIELTGHEVKSAKDGRMNIAGTYVIFRNEQAFLIGSEISSFQAKNAPEDFKAKRSRKLLLKKKELKYLSGKTASTSLTVVPLRVYIKNNLVKVEIGLVRKKKEKDKREQIKKRDMQRDVEREFRKRMQ